MGGGHLLKISSLSRLLPSVYPQYKWEQFKFNRPPTDYWEKLFEGISGVFRRVMCRCGDEKGICKIFGKGAKNRK